MAERKRNRITIPEFLERMPSPQARQTAQRLLEVAREGGGIIYRGDAGISIRYPSSPAWPHPISVAWLYPGERGWLKTREFSFGRQTLWKGPESLPAEVRQVLKEWADSFARTPYACDVSSTGVSAWAVSHAAAVKHGDELAARLHGVLAALQMLDSEAKEDYYQAVEILERIRQGKEKVYSAAEVRAYLGLDG